MHDKGLSVSYQRLTHISAGKASHVLEEYASNGIVCPSSLQDEYLLQVIWIILITTHHRCHLKMHSMEQPNRLLNMSWKIMKLLLAL